MAGKRNIVTSRLGTIKDPEILAHFATIFDRCWFCGISQYECQREGRWPPALQIHHIIKLHRSDERVNLSRTCDRCHRLIEGERIRDDRTGIHFPNLRLEHVLWAKREFDKVFYDRARLATIYHRSLPRIRMVPSPLKDEMERRLRKLYGVEIG